MSIFQKDKHAAMADSLVRQMVEEIVRKAISEQARELEQHLTDIHTRLLALEKK